jgi:hypothetical protein
MPQSRDRGYSVFPPAAIRVRGNSQRPSIQLWLNFLLHNQDNAGVRSRSVADLRLTRRIVADARVLKINFVDHVIVGQAMAVGLGYFSFEERVLASVHKCLRLCDLCKELAFCAPARKGEVAISYNSFAFSMLCRQFLESAMSPHACDWKPRVTGVSSRSSY